MKELIKLLDSNLILREYGLVDEIIRISQNDSSLTTKKYVLMI